MDINCPTTKPIAIKIGSNVITRKDGTLDVTRMSALVDQIANLKQLGFKIILISSGAVAAGKTILTSTTNIDSVSSRQLFSSIGQVKLIDQYFRLFGNYNIICGQILATKEDFSTRLHYLNQKNCISVMLENDVIPIVNENDTTSVNELMFTDNDELSGMIATMINCQKLIILSNINGIYNGNPTDEKSTIIKEINSNITNIENFIFTSKSSAGRGGMITKYKIARKVADEGIEVIIANGKKENILLQLLTEKDAICTKFTPSKKDISNIKKWIAHSDSFAKGEIHINTGAKEALMGDKAISLLPIGITRINGNFEKDDIVIIIDEDLNQIGVGRTSFNSSTIKDLIGKDHKKAIIHYNYLYIDK